RAPARPAELGNLVYRHCPGDLEPVYHGSGPRRWAHLVARREPPDLLVPSRRQDRTLRETGEWHRGRATAPRARSKQGSSGLVIGWSLSVVHDARGDTPRPMGAPLRPCSRRADASVGEAISGRANHLRRSPGAVFSGYSVGWVNR